MSAPRRHVPVPTAETAPFWEGCRAGELRVQRCRACGAAQFYPRALCAPCGSRELAWERGTGRGTLRSWSIVRRGVNAAYDADGPYVLVLVELEEGPTLMSTLVGVRVGPALDAAEGVAIGAPVEVAFEAWQEGATVPRFRLVRRPEA
ncbi:MAG: OB-fold domain-containing protein [Steroidobacteraceae bacterium]|jgi:uncharacterized OB-fold protein|nr:OB-fold domain-containing protein [Steroidobacteraceae bacterium]